MLGRWFRRVGHARLGIVGIAFATLLPLEVGEVAGEGGDELMDEIEGCGARGRVGE